MLCQSVPHEFLQMKWRTGLPVALSVMYVIPVIAMACWSVVVYCSNAFCLSVVICGMLPFSVPFSLTLMLSFRSVIGRISPSQ